MDWEAKVFSIGYDMKNNGRVRRTNRKKIY